MEVSKTIRAIRESKGLTQVDVAERLGTERSNYARLESRDVNLTIKQLIDIASALEVSVYDIMGDVTDRPRDGKVQSGLSEIQEKLRTTTEILKAKQYNIKYYKSFIYWTRDKFVQHFNIAALTVAKRLELRDIEPSDDEDLLLSTYNFTEDELRQIGDYMFSLDAPDYFLNGFMASFGFVSEKWFIEAYKRDCRKRKEKINYAEVRNWVDGVFEFLEGE